MNLPGSNPSPSEDPIEACERQLLEAIREADDESPLEVRVIERSGVPVICLEGELEMFTAGLLEKELDRVLDGQPERMLIDLTGLTYVDSTGLGLLLRAARRVEGRLGVIVPKERIARLFKVAGLTHNMALHRTLAEALEGAASH